jgi:hypothetical protein
MKHALLDLAAADQLGRHLFFAEVGAVADLLSLALPANRFALFLAADTSGIPVNEIYDPLEALQRSGLVYLCCWGPDCERVHDLADEAQVQLELAGELSSEGVIMTTWHADESLASALWFFTSSAQPDERYTEGCDSAIAVVVNNASWSESVMRYLRNPTELERDSDAD